MRGTILHTQHGTTIFQLLPILYLYRWLHHLQKKTYKEVIQGHLYLYILPWEKVYINVSEPELVIEKKLIFRFEYVGSGVNLSVFQKHCIWLSRKSVKMKITCF